jgi:uncharacterized protein DUF6544
MNRTVVREARALLERSEQLPPGGVITTDQVQGVPEAAARYLRYAGVVGKEPIRTVHLKQRGFMRMQPGQKWLPVVAEQYFTTSPPAFLWHTTIRPFPLVSISATDRFSEGHGTMRIRLWSAIPLGNARGPEMDQGELQRYLLEMAWFPTAWLTSAIEWQAIDAHSVKATIYHQEVMASGVLHVNEQGQLTRLSADRYREEHGHYSLDPWTAESSEYEEVEGMRIPTSSEVTWHLSSGDFTWFRFKIIEIEYNQSGRITRW